MDFKKFIILSLACYRLAQLIADDDGPLSIFGRVRQWIDVKAKLEQEKPGPKIMEKPGPYRKIMEKKWQSIDDGINCPFCVGVWIAALLTVVYTGIHRFTPIYIFAIAGLQAWLEGVKR